MPDRVLLHIHPYSAEQIERPMTLGDLKSMISTAIEFYGEEAEVVTHDCGNRYGAKFGKIDHQDIAPEEEE